MTTIGFIGGGNMASALIGGLIQSARDAQSLHVLDRNADKRAALARDFGVHTHHEVAGLLAASDVIMLAIKPQELQAVARGLQLRADQLVISIAPGIRSSDLVRWLSGHEAVVRAMPNTPALIGAGITGLYAREAVDAAQRATADTVLRAAGQTVWVDSEAQLDALTAISGCGPAYVFYFIEALEAAALKLGLSAAHARALALGTVDGAARLAAQSSDAPGVLREKVTSKGGATAAALASLAADTVDATILKACQAANRRARELRDVLGQA